MLAEIDDKHWAYEVCVQRIPNQGYEPFHANSASKVAKYLYGLGLAEEMNEKFFILMLDSKSYVTAHSLISSGLLDRAPIHPRELFRPAVMNATASIILAHNHPSGDVTPSGQDIQMTQAIIDAGELLKIPVLDHLIVGYDCKEKKRTYCSLREDAFVTFNS